MRHANPFLLLILSAGACGAVETTELEARNVSYDSDAGLTLETTVQGAVDDVAATARYGADKADEMAVEIASLEVRIDELEVRPPAIPKLELVTFAGHHLGDHGESALVPNRSLTFTKHHDSTWMRIVYTDQFRGRDPYGTGACTWEVEIDGSSCTDPGPLRHVAVVADPTAGTALGTTATLTGFCAATTAGPLMKGAHALTVFQSASTSATCETGSDDDAGAPGLLSAEEVETQ